MKRKFPLYALSTLLLVIIGTLAYSFYLVEVNGPHPDCGREPIVGPCDYTGASLHTAGWISVPAACVWVTMLFLGLLWRIIRRGSKPSLPEALLLAVCSLPLAACLLLAGYILTH